MPILPKATVFGKIGVNWEVNHRLWNMSNALIADLRSALKILAAKIEPKVYKYGFLKRQKKDYGMSYLDRIHFFLDYTKQADSLENVSSRFPAGKRTAKWCPN